MAEKWANIATPTIDSVYKENITGKASEVVLTQIKEKNKKQNYLFLVNCSNWVCAWRHTCHEGAHTHAQVPIAVFIFVFQGKVKEARMSTLILSNTCTKLKHHKNTREEKPS